MLKQIAKLLDKGWVETQADAPLLYPGDRIQIARRAFDATGLVRGDDPRMIAALLEFRVVRAPWLSGCGGGITDGNVIAYRPHPDPAIEVARAAHELAHALLYRERWQHTETDALLLTADFILP